MLISRGDLLAFFFFLNHLLVSVNIPAENDHVAYCITEHSGSTANEEPGEEFLYSTKAFLTLMYNHSYKVIRIFNF